MLDLQGGILLRRFLAAIVCITILFAFTGCGGSAKKTYHDGVYTARFKNYDSYGYKDFVRVEVKDGVVTHIDFNGINELGELKTDDKDYESQMTSVRDTNPKRYTADLINQMLDKENINEVDDVAGATWSSACFKKLYSELEQRMVAGDTTLLEVDNVPEK